jgi:DNA-binding protein HU-beta
VTKSELIQLISADAGLSQSQTGKIVNRLFDAIAEALQKGDEVRLTGFGTFRVTDTAARTGRNPRTGTAIQIPPGKRVSFAAGTGLVGAVRGEGRSASG